MLDTVILDRSAEARQQLHALITKLTRSNIPEQSFLPKISLRVLSPNELRLHGLPDLCIVGHEIIGRGLAEVSGIRKTLPDAAILAVLPEGTTSLTFIEQVIRLGADDVMLPDISAQEFFQKILVLSRRTAKQKSGKLIVVDGAKGGVGVTSIAAGLAESLVDPEKHVCVIDLDFESQALSRFMQVRPFINENLELILREDRSTSQEFIEQALVPVYDGDSSFLCMPPVPESDALYDSKSNYSRNLIAVLEVLDALFDYVVIDTGNARGAMIQSLYHVADKVIFVINNDPASLYCSTQRLARLKGYMAPDAQLVVLENGTNRGGLHNSYLKEEFTRTLNLEADSWAEPLPHCKLGAGWPGSGGAMYSQGGGKMVAGITALLSFLNLLPAERSSGLLSYCQRMVAALPSTLSGAPWRKPKEITSDRTSRAEISASPPPFALLPEPKAALPSSAAAVVGQLGAANETATAQENLEPEQLFSAVNFS